MRIRWVIVPLLAIGALIFYVNEDSEPATVSDEPLVDARLKLTTGINDKVGRRPFVESAGDAGSLEAPRAVDERAAPPEKPAIAAAYPPVAEPAGPAPAAGASVVDDLEAKPTRAQTLARAGARMTNSGLCETLKNDRDALVSSFRRVDLDDGIVLIDPALPEQIISRVSGSLRVGRAATTELFALERPTRAPLVVVYRSLKDMRSVSCVNTSAYGYYDGAIHLSGNPNGGLTQLEETLVHEYVHHVLMQLGVRLPMWLSEGTAMLVAGESWWKEPSLALEPWLQSTHLPFEMVVTEFAHATDEKTATAMYFQSLVMVEFVRARAGDAGLRELLKLLATGALSPDDAFTTASNLTRAEADAAFGAWAATFWRMHASSR